MSTRFRSRVTPRLGSGASMNIYRSTPWSAEVLYRSAPTCYFSTLEESYVNDELHVGPPYKSGGLFLLNSARYPAEVYNSGSWTKVVGSYTYRAQGGFIVNPYAITGITSLPIGNTTSTMHGNDADNYGAAAWSKHRPGKPSHSLGQMLAEARDIPGMVKGSYSTISDFVKSLKSSSKNYAYLWKNLGGRRYIKDTPKTIAAEFLNNQFGWVPFLSDCKSLYSLCSKIDKEAIQLKRDNGQWVRREGTVYSGEEDSVRTLSSSTTASALEPSGYYYYPFTPTSGAQGSFSAIESIKTRVWFVGMFRYFIPEFNGPDWYWPAMRKAYGLSLTPTLIYELTPWSWLVDWFSNIGDNIANFDAIINDGLVAKYAYVMKKKVKSVDVTHRQKWLTGIISVVSHWEWSHKNRSLAPPYSFSWNQGTLSTWQQAILTAIGVTRFR